jgi:hypothetical protein
MALSEREEKAWDRLVRAACVAADSLSRERAKRLRSALDGRCRVEVLRAAAEVWIGSHGGPDWYRGLDSAMEGLFRACTGAVGPTVHLWGSSTGYTGGVKRRRGRPPKVREDVHAG